MEKDKKIKNNTLYSFKTLACFCIILIHCNFPGKFGELSLVLSRWAVPFFFMISGYFSFFENSKMVKETIDKRIKNICKMVLIAFIGYFILHLLIILYQGDIQQYISEIIMPTNLLKFICLNWTTPYVGVGHLWYLFAMIYVYLLYKLISKYNLYKPSYIYSFISIFGIYLFEIINKYYELGVETIWWRNFLFLGFPFFMLGHFIHKNEKKVKAEEKRLKKVLGIVLISSICILIFEIILFKSSFDLYLNSVVIAVLSFLIALNYPNIKFLNEIGEKDSSSIYIIHYAVIIIICKILNNYNVDIIILKYIQPFMVFGISLLFSIIFRKVKRFK